MRAIGRRIRGGRRNDRPMPSPRRCLGLWRLAPGRKTLDVEDETSRATMPRQRWHGREAQYVFPVEFVHAGTSFEQVAVVTLDDDLIVRHAWGTGP